MANIVLDYPSAQAIAWIPFYRGFNDLKSNSYWDYGNTSSKHKLACHLLFSSGNKPEPSIDILENQQTFNSFLSNSKNYRGALALRDLKMICYEDGSFKVICKTLPKKDSIGYTPIRFVTKHIKLLFYQKGIGSILKPTYRHEIDGVRISHIVYFRIGRIGNLVAKILTGFYAPKAHMRIDYFLKNDGSCTVDFSGSYIPNQAWYLIEKKYSWKFDMMTNNLNNIRAFFEPDDNAKIAEGNYLPHKAI